MPWLTRLVASPRKRAAALALALVVAVPAGHSMFGLYANLRSDLEALLPAALGSTVRRGGSDKPG